MSPDRTPLFASLILQGFVGFTFGVAFLGLWRSFRRESALRLTGAWMLIGVGVWWAMLALSQGWGERLPSLLQAIVPGPTLWGLILLRPAVDALVEEAAPGPPSESGFRPYLPFALGCTILLVAAAPIAWATLPESGGAVAAFVVPRTLFAAATIWVLWPLLGLKRSLRPAGYALIVAALLGMAVRMASAAGNELVRWVTSVPSSPESVVLSFLQVSFLILLGVGFSIAVTDREGKRALADADTIRQTAEALRTSERRFRFLVERSSDLLVMVDAAGVLTYVAPTSRPLLGLPSDRLESRRLEDVVHPHDREEAERLLNPTTLDGHGVVSHVRLAHSNGEWRDFEVSRPRRPSEGSSAPDQTVLSLRDVTEKRRLESQVLHAQSLDSLGFMAGSMAHDFNNTLLAVQAGAELLAEDLEDAGGDFKEQALEILEAAERGGATVRQLLDFSRRRRASPTVFDVVERVRDLEVLVSRAVGLSIDVVVETPAQPILVRAVAEQLDQVLLNLAVNAKHAMPDGGQLWVHIDVPPAGSGPSDVRIDVHDSGCGIPHDVLDKVFEPFYTTRGDDGGTGLGLATARGFAQRSGGTLRVESAEGEGTCFSLVLPAVPSDAEAATPA